MNHDIALAGVSTRFQPGRSGNPGGRHQSASITRRIRALLETNSDRFEAIKVIELAEGPGAADRWNAESLTVGDLIAMALVGLALNRSQKIPPAVQLQAIAMITDRIDGKSTDKTPSVDAADDERRLMTVDDFRRAVNFASGATSSSPSLACKGEDS